jgi:hypothetical protein
MEQKLPIDKLNGPVFTAISKWLKNRETLENGTTGYARVYNTRLHTYIMVTLYLDINATHTHIYNIVALYFPLQCTGIFAIKFKKYKSTNTLTQEFGFFHHCFLGRKMGQ